MEMRYTVQMATHVYLILLIPIDLYAVRQSALVEHVDFAVHVDGRKSVV